MTEQDIEAKRKIYRNLSAFGYNGFTDCLELLDVIEKQQRQLNEIKPPRIRGKMLRPDQDKMLRPQSDK